MRGSSNGIWPVGADFCVSTPGVGFRHVTPGHVSNKGVGVRVVKDIYWDLARWSRFLRLHAGGRIPSWSARPRLEQGGRSPCGEGYLLGLVQL